MRTKYILLALLLLSSSCRDTPRDNPFDPESELLMVSVLSPADSSVFRSGDKISFRAAARTGYDNLPAGRTFLWRSNIAGTLSERSDFSIDSLPVGTHRVTVLVAGDRDRSGSAFVRVIVLPLPEFGAVIVNPPGDTTFLAGSTITPSAVEYVPQGSTIIGRLWSFGIGSRIGVSAEKDPGAVTWSQAGAFELIYQIVDNMGRTAADTVIVNVLSESTPPVAAIASPPKDTVIAVGASLRLDAVEVETSARIASRLWVYPEGSGLESLVDTLASPGLRTFSMPGVFEITFRVTDILGISAADTVVVTVNDTLGPPVAGIVSPAGDTTIVAGDSLFFEGHFSPEQGVSMLWSYGEGSGHEGTPDTVAAPGWRMFGLPGAFRVSFRVADLSGRSSGDSLLVTVVENQGPQAVITAPSADTTVTAGDSVLFQGTASDPDRGITSLAWYSRAGAESPRGEIAQGLDVFSHVFEAEGTYRIYFKVTDNHGAEAEDSVAVTVEPAPPPNEPPAAEILSPSADTTVVAWSQIVFTARDSDPDGTVVSRRWFYPKASGVEAEDDTSSTTGLRTFPRDGEFVVIYTVTDNWGDTASDSVVILVQANVRPTVQIISPIGDQSITAGEYLTFIGLDNDYDGFIVARTWDYGEGSGIDAAADTTAVPGNRYFNIAGDFRVVYTVTDNVGISRSDSLSLHVAPAL